MPQIRSVSLWLTVALVGVAAYLGARASARSVRARLDDIAAHVHKTDYWTVYEQAQKDLLKDDNDDGEGR